MYTFFPQVLCITYSLPTGCLGGVFSTLSSTNVSFQNIGSCASLPHHQMYVVGDQRKLITEVMQGYAGNSARSIS
ncbi:hypothetical protein J3A83DRAFT_4262648 [Scleroderma citrinum]